MKKYIYAAVCWVIAVYAGANVVLSNPVSVPTEGVVVSQLTHDAVNLQSRHTSPTDWKGVGQAFTWSVDDDLDGVGMFIETATFSSDQQHWFILSQLDGNGGPVTNTVYQKEFTMSAANVASNQWVHFDIDDQVMVNGGYYAVTIVATEEDTGGQRIYWACGADTNYPGGEANQIDPIVRGLPPSSSHDFATSANRDTVFYMQAVPEPVSLSNPVSVPIENIVVSQINQDSTVQSRYTSATNWRGVSQTFEWNSAQGLRAAGLYVASYANTTGRDQNYIFAIQKLDASLSVTSPTVVSNVLETVVVLTTNNMASGTWMQFDFGELTLENGATYGLFFGPDVSLPYPENARSDIIINWAWNVASNAYAGGGASQPNTTTNGVPLDVGSTFGANGTKDLVFYLQAVAGLPSTNAVSFWNNWISAYPGVGGSSNLLDHGDSDGLDNLTEYAWGGDPANGSLQGNTPMQAQVADGGTNYIEYVYFERTDAGDRGLASILTVGSDLVATNWADGSGYEVGRGASGETGFDVVTNRIPMDTNQKFIRLQVEFTP